MGSKYVQMLELLTISSHCRLEYASWDVDLPHPQCPPLIILTDYP